MGHIFDCCLSFVKYGVCKECIFEACVNKIVTEVGFAHPRCKTKMVKMYGTSFYGCCLWDLFGPDCQNVSQHGILPWELYLNSQIQLICDF